MPISRREFLKLSALVTTSAALSGCGPIFRGLAGSMSVTDWSPMNAHDFTVLNRLTFGARPDERARFLEVGLKPWIEEQLDIQSIDDLDCSLRLAPFRSLEMEANELEAISNQLFENYDRESLPAELRLASLIRQVYSRRQLYEVMVGFWNDHLNIFTEKGNCFYLKTVDDRRVVRTHALGSFRELILASAHSPAMLVYLDNHVNHKGAPNENYARELMELHTLGVNGGYSQADVMELARCLTGWTVKDHFWLGDFEFNADLHDPGVKYVLGMEISNSGINEAEKVIDTLSTHPSTARFISSKLAWRFIADDPPEELIQKGARAFLDTEGDIKSVLRVILLDGVDFVQPKYKRPSDFVISALRMLHAQTDGRGPDESLRGMGQSLFGCPTPDGYPDNSAAWQGNLMPRWNFAFRLVRGEIEGTQIDMEHLLAYVPDDDLTVRFDALATLLLGVPIAEPFRSGLMELITSGGTNEEEMLQILAAGILVSPSFQWK